MAQELLLQVISQCISFIAATRTPDKMICASIGLLKTTTDVANITFSTDIAPFKVNTLNTEAVIGIVAGVCGGKSN